MHAVGALAAVLVLQRGDGRGDAVVGERGRDRHEREAGQGRGVLRDVERAAAADPHEGVVEAVAQALAEVDRRLHGAAFDAPELPVPELG
jgi:hypothetical protein